MKSVLPRTIQGRFVLSHLMVSLFSIILISVYSAGVLYRSLSTQVEREYEDLGLLAVRDLEQMLVKYHEGELTEAVLADALHDLFVARPGIHYTLYLSDGAPLVDSSGELPAKIIPSEVEELQDALNNEIGKSSTVRRDEAGSQRLFLVFRIEEGENILGILVLDVPLSVALGEARRSLGLLLATALVLALGMGAVGYYLAKSFAEPIENITQAAGSLAGGELGVRVDAPLVPHEIFQLSRAFNFMAARIETLVSELRSFVANASHELRTPLTSIKLRVEALRSGAIDDPPVAERFLAEIESEVDRLSSMVNDLLDLSRLEAGLEASRLIPVDLGGIVAEVYEVFSVRADRAGVLLSYHVDPGLPAVIGSEDQLRRMLYNLVDNAIKYTHQGGEVELSLHPGERKETQIVAVKDTGFGIAPVQLPHVFDRFYRVEATRPRYGPPQGSGLGLPIAKSIAEAHGGTIGVTSQVGKGSTFWVELPVALEN